MLKLVLQTVVSLQNRVADAVLGKVENPYVRPPVRPSPRPSSPSTAPRNAAFGETRASPGPDRLALLPAESRLQIYDNLSQTHQPTALIALADAHPGLREEIRPIVEAFAVACAVKDAATVAAFPQRLRSLTPCQRLVPLFNFAFHELNGPLDASGEVEDAFRESLADIAPALHGRMKGVLDVPRSDRALRLWKAAKPDERVTYLRSILFYSRTEKGMRGKPTQQEYRNLRRVTEQEHVCNVGVQRRRFYKPDYDQREVQLALGLTDPDALDWALKVRGEPSQEVHDDMQRNMRRADAADARWERDSRARRTQRALEAAAADSMSVVGHGIDGA